MSDTQAAAPVDDIVVETSDPHPSASVDAAHPSVSADPGDEDPDAVDASDAGRKLQAKRGSLQARIDAITREKYETARERDEIRQRAESAERELHALKTPKPAAVATPTGKPSVDQFQTYDEYVEALTDWKTDQKLAAADTQRAEREYRGQVQQRHAEHTQTFVERISEAEQTDPGFWAKLDPDVVNLRPSGSLAPQALAQAQQAAQQGNPGARQFLARTAIADVVFTSDHSIDLLRTLTASDLQRLAALPPNALYRELGKIEARFGTPAVHSGPAAAPRMSSAPAPIKPVGSAASAGDASDITGEESVDDHIRKMNALEKRQNRRR